MNTIDPQEANQPKRKPPRQGILQITANYFQFDRYKTNFRTEILAGITTFMTMAYIRAISF